MGELILMNLYRPALGMQFFRHSVDALYDQSELQRSKQHLGSLHAQDRIIRHETMISARN